MQRVRGVVVGLVWVRVCVCLGVLISVCVPVYEGMCTCIGVSVNVDVSAVIGIGGYECG